MARASRYKPDQEKVIRDFLAACECVGIILPRKHVAHFLTQMGYKIAPNGARVHADLPLSFRMGADITNAWEDTYDADWEETTGNATEPDPSSGLSSEGE